MSLCWATREHFKGGSEKLSLNLTHLLKRLKISLTSSCSVSSPFRYFCMIGLRHSKLLLSGKNHEAFQKQHFSGQPLIPFQGGDCKARKSVIVVPCTCLPDSNNYYHSSSRPMAYQTLSHRYQYLKLHISSTFVRLFQCFFM